MEVIVIVIPCYTHDNPRPAAQKKGFTHDRLRPQYRWLCFGCHFGGRCLKLGYSKIPWSIIIFPTFRSHKLGLFLHVDSHNIFLKKCAVCRLAFGFSGPPCFQPLGHTVFMGTPSSWILIIPNQSLTSFYKEFTNGFIFPRMLK